MCTVLLRLRPGGKWPLLLAAIRDEMLDRAWDPPSAHWPSMPSVQGGRDRVAGGTWMAVDRDRAVVGALLNGVRLPLRPGEDRPSRGSLPLAAIEATEPVDPWAVQRYDGFHLLRADRESATLWSWDGGDLRHEKLSAGDHIIVNEGLDSMEDPLVPHFLPLLKALPDPDPRPGLPVGQAWDGWIDLLRGDGLAPTDERGLIIEHDLNGARYGSSSASLVALAAGGAVRYDFTATPRNPRWTEVRY